MAVERGAARHGARVQRRPPVCPRKGPPRDHSQRVQGADGGRGGRHVLLEPEPEHVDWVVLQLPSPLGDDAQYVLPRAPGRIQRQDRLGARSVAQYLLQKRQL